MTNTFNNNFLEYAELKDSPYILLDLNNHILNIKGRAYSDISTIRINRIADKIKELKPYKLMGILQIDYVNSSSTKALYNLFDSIQNNVDISELIWKVYTDDIDSIDLVNMFKEVFKFNFKLETYE